MSFDHDTETVDLSVVIPVRNEIRHIDRCLDSIRGQEVGDLRIELLVVDGLSDDGTRDAIARQAQRDPRIRRLDNPRRTVSPALNIGLAAARGDVVVRMDAHSVYESDYLMQSITVLRESGCDAVGGLQMPIPGAATAMARAIAAAQQSAFFHGGGAHRRRAYEGPAQSLSLGAFSRRLALQIGGFDDELFRSEDNDFYQRLREAGARLWLSPHIRARYLCRPTLGALFGQVWVTGAEIAPTLVRNPRAMSFRHLAPGLALAGALVLIPSSAVVPGGLWLPVSAIAAAGLIYLGMLVATSLRLAREQGAELAAPLMLTFPTAHLGYALGTSIGMFRAPLARRRGPRPADRPLGTPQV